MVEYKKRFENKVADALLRRLEEDSVEEGVLAQKAVSIVEHG